MGQYLLESRQKATFHDSVLNVGLHMNTLYTPVSKDHSGDDGGQHSSTDKHPNGNSGYSACTAGTQQTDGRDGKMHS